jgi:hypothetical protein
MKTGQLATQFPLWALLGILVVYSLEFSPTTNGEADTFCASISFAYLFHSDGVILYELFILD